ncbi:MAG: thiamine pyrophosphate-dependent enzyme [Nitrospinota bacterium]
MTRYQALKVLAARLKNELCIVSLGGIVNEWYNARPEPKGTNLYLMALGCHIPLALGVALGLPHRKVLCLDTDGSVLMNMSVLGTLANRRPKNLSVIVFDNEMYECNGGMPSHTSGNLDLAGMALGAGIPDARSVRTEGEMREAVDEVLTTDRHHFIVAKIEPGTQQGLPIKLTDGIEDKYNFVRYIEQSEGVAVLPALTGEAGQPSRDRKR